MATFDEILKSLNQKNQAQSNQFDALLNAKNLQSSLADVGQAGANIGAAIAGLSGLQPIKADTSLYQSQREQADNLLNSFLAKKKLEDQASQEAAGVAFKQSELEQEKLKQENIKSQKEQELLQKMKEAEDRKLENELRRKDLEETKAARLQTAQENQSIKQQQLDLQKQVAQDKEVQKYQKQIEPIQQIQSNLGVVESILGAPLEKIETDPNKNLVKVQGKAIDLPGISIPGIGRVTSLSPDARVLEGSIASVFNTVLKDRSGAAVTTPELERLKTEFGAGKYNTESEMISALKKYKAVTDDLLNKKSAAFDKDVIAKYNERLNEPKQVQAAKSEDMNQMKPAPYGQTVKQNGKMYKWDGQNYIESK